MMAAPAANDDLICDECGRYGALDFDARQLCPDCYECSGSCCPEFGKVEPEQGDAAAPTGENFSTPATPPR